MNFRLIENDDWPVVWSMLEPIFREGESFPQATDISEHDAHQTWIEAQQYTYVAETLDGHILGTYTLKPNSLSLGAHVCNCGYIVSEHARGQGVASAMCKHSQQEGIRLGYSAMQYNLVVSTNDRAVQLWTKMGFDRVGTLPGAFKSSRYGYVDAYVMFKNLI